MRAKAKSSKTPHPIWVEGEYITKPPVRPKDGAIRPEGHYIDKGGYPGANVYEIDTDTFCRDTGATDKRERPIYERDILLWETQEEIAYFIIENVGQAVDIVNGEILEVQQLEKENIKVIGNLVDSEEFIESIQYHLDNDKPIPYVPLSVTLPELWRICYGWIYNKGIQGKRKSTCIVAYANASINHCFVAIITPTQIILQGLVKVN